MNGPFSSLPALVAGDAYWVWTPARSLSPAGVLVGDPICTTLAVIAAR
jgi:hypothetical protein